MTKLGGGGSCSGSTGGTTVLRQAELCLAAGMALAGAVVCSLSRYTGQPHVHLFATGSYGSSKSLSRCQDQAGLGWWLVEGIQRKPAWREVRAQASGGWLTPDVYWERG